MTPLKQCPFCNSGKVFSGSIKSQGWFCPHEAKIPFWEPVVLGGLSFGPEAQMCVACGRIWSDIDSDRALTFMHRYGSPQAKAKL
jgi:hypothetical protein